jgi:acetyl-CoA acetyltransferase family protein
MGASMGTGFGAPFGPRVAARYSERGGLVPQGVAAERLIDSFGLSREELDAYGAASRARAARAAAEGRFGREIVPVAALRRAGDLAGPTGNGLAIADECISPTTAEELAELKPSFVPGGHVTAGNSAQIGDGASAALIMAEEVAERLGYRPRARFCGFALAGVDPLLMLSGPIPATRKVLDRCSLTVDDIDVAEVNEAFAAVVLAWAKDLQADVDKVNANGGAIALGHPLGASGTRLLATLVNELERCGGRFGLQTMCEAGGMANALVIERLG